MLIVSICMGIHMKRVKIYLFPRQVYDRHSLPVAAGSPWQSSQSLYLELSLTRLVMTGSDVEQ